jgi:hypothetical protein
MRWLLLFSQAASALIVHVKAGKDFCATFPESDIFEAYNISTSKDVLLARWGITGEEDAVVKVYLLNVEKDKKEYTSEDAEGEVLLDAPSKVKFKFCVSSAYDAQLIFALHRGPKLSELADPKWFGKWSKCANEGGVCKCNGKVRFGARSGPPVWKILNYTSAVKCSSEAFGGDPSEGAAGKRCECASPVGADGWTECAKENGQCICPVGEKAKVKPRVRFGGVPAGFFESKEVHGSIQCNAETFGDPLKGTVKFCDCFTTELKPATESQTTKEGAFDAIEHLSATEVTRAMVVDMYRIARDLKERQEQLQAMDDALDEISTKTTVHVTGWAAVQSIGLVLIALFQIYYLKSFFEVKQLI